MQRIVPGTLAGCLLLLLVGCEPATPPAAVPDEAAAPAAPVAAAPPAAPAAPPPPPPAATAVLRALTPGDRACYLTLEDSQGLAREEMGRMELCEQATLVGQPILPVYGEEAVAAESCQGDPECTETETVRLLVELQPVR